MGAFTYTAKKGIKLLSSEIGAWLVDNVAETVIGGNLVTNGSFTTDTSGWSPSNGATLASISSELRVTAGASINPGAVQFISGLVVGQSYIAYCVARIGTTAGTATLYDGTSFLSDGTTSATNVTLSFKFTAIATTHTFYCYIAGGSVLPGDTSFFDEVNVVRVSDDLSVTAIPMEYNGSVVKSAVASGSEVMAFSSFTTSNYLSREYGSDLDINGANAVSVAAWISFSTLASVQAIAGNLSIGGSGDRGGYGLRMNGTKLEFSVSDSAGIITSAADPTNLSTDEYFFAVGTLDASGNILLYKDATLVHSNTGAVPDATASEFKVGVLLSSGALANPATYGKILGVRVYPSVLTPTEIKTMYDLEKDLFKANTILTIVDNSYDLDVALSQIDRSENPEGSEKLSLGGNQVNIQQRNDIFYDITITNLQSSDLPELRTFLQSVNNGESFIFDPYGSIASPDELLTVKAKTGFKESRVGNSDYFTIPMRLRVVE